MVSSVLALLLAVSATQSDTTRTSREAYTRCLRAFMQHSVEGRMAVDAFNTALATTCAAEKTAFHDAVVRRETASRATRATAEQSATEEVDEATAISANCRGRDEPAASGPVRQTAGCVSEPAAHPATALQRGRSAKRPDLLGV